jgi:hypothetical protein
MWERLEAFWDGEHSLLLGVFDGNAAPFGPVGELAVFSHREFGEDAGSTLLDIVPADRRPGYWLVRLPPEHRHINIRTADAGAGPELQISLVLPPFIAGGSWNVLVANAPASPNEDVDFRTARRAATANPDRLYESQLRESGGRAVAALLQHRSEQRDGQSLHIQLAPLRVVWPQQHARILIEPVERPSPSRRERYRDFVPAFSILELWLRESPPAITIRVFPGEIGGPADMLLARIAVVHVMHQRWHLREWRRQRREAGDPSVDLLTIEEMRGILGDVGAGPAAAMSKEPIVAFNLYSALSAAQPEALSADGIHVRQGGAPGSKWAEIEFPGAALGDDVGLVCNWADENDITVRPQDPGGTPQARLFRVTDSALSPIAVDAKYRLLDEVLRLAGDHEIGAPPKQTGEGGTPADRTAVTALFDSFTARLRGRGADVIDVARGQGWQAISAAVYVAAATIRGSKSVEAAERIGGYQTFESDPAIVGAVARNPELVEGVSISLAVRPRTVSSHLAHRLANWLGMPNLVETDLAPDAQIAAWRVLRNPGTAGKLTATRITLAGAAEVMPLADWVADVLSDESVLPKVIVSLRDRGETSGLSTEEARAPAALGDALAGYVQRRRRGEWTSLPDAAALARTVEGVKEYWQEFESLIITQPPAAKAPAPDDERSPSELLDAVNALLRRLHALPVPPTELQNLVAIFGGWIEKGQPDRFVLQHFEARLLNLIELPAEEVLVEKIVAKLEDWAEVSSFARSMVPRLPLNGPPPYRLRDILAAYVDRTARSVPRKHEKGGDLERCREELASKVAAHFEPKRGRTGDRSNIAHDVGGYGEILLLHHAYMGIREIVDALQGHEKLSHEVARLKCHLGIWPHRASDAWDEAISLARSHLPSEIARRLTKRISPPLDL